MNSPDQLQQATHFLEESTERGAGDGAAAVGSMALEREVEQATPSVSTAMNISTTPIVGPGYGGVPVVPEQYQPL